MRLIKVAAGILNQTPLAWDQNKRNILAAIEAARAQSVSVLCLPELCISGYGCEDAFFSQGLQNTAVEILDEVRAATQGIIVAVGLPLHFEYGLFNSACLISDRKIVGFVCKQFLANEGIHYEPRWFKPWPNGKRGQLRLLGAEYPIGDQYFTCDDLRIGFEICEDAWVPNRPGRKLAERSVDLILNPSASHFAFGKFEVRKRFVLEGSRAFGTSYVYSNLSGNEAGRAIYDAGALIASGGKLLAQGQRFIYRDWDLTSATIDVDLTRLMRARGPDIDAQISTQSDALVNFDFSLPKVQASPCELKLAPWENSLRIKEEEFARAVALGLFDYMRKSRSSGFVVSLSGGADSSAISCLVALMVQFGLADLGRDRFLEKLSYIKDLSTCSSDRQLVEKLLTCVYQATRYSGEVTRGAAAGLAEALGANFISFEIEELVKSYLSLGEQALGRELNWQHDDLALQNIQARVRGPSVWLLANLKNALLLATSNRSEAAVGYTTMDGDTCGGLSPIAGIDKAFLREWLHWLEREGPTSGQPVAALAAVNVQEPTAELRPAQSKQTDEGDLMPYEVLDVIERLAIRDKKTPLEAYEQLSVRFSKYSAADLKTWVARFFTMWCRNQWKRERYAPSFHLDDESLDPKTWCRFPILSGGYEREIEELFKR